MALKFTFKQLSLLIEIFSTYLGYMELEAFLANIKIDIGLIWKLKSNQYGIISCVECHLYKDASVSVNQLYFATTLISPILWSHINYKIRYIGKIHYYHPKGPNLRSFTAAKLSCFTVLSLLTKRYSPEAKVQNLQMYCSMLNTIVGFCEIIIALACLIWWLSGFLCKVVQYNTGVGTSFVV